MAANKMLGARKEAILQVKDEEGTVVREHRLLFSTRALADAEAKIGKSMTQILGGFGTGRSGVREIALLVQAGLEAQRRDGGISKEPVSYDEACDLVDLIGLSPTAEAINDAIAAVFSYGKPSEEGSDGSASPDAGTAPNQPDADRPDDPNA